MKISMASLAAAATIFGEEKLLPVVLLTLCCAVYANSIGKLVALLVWFCSCLYRLTLTLQYVVVLSKTTGTLEYHAPERDIA